MPGPNITISHPLLPEGWKGTPDAFTAWQDKNAVISISGNGFITGSMTGPAPSNAASDQGAFIDPGGRSLEVWNASAGEYVTIGEPVGVIHPYIAINISQPPANYLFCEGQSLSRSTYPDLFNAIGTAWGSADADSFSLPDLRGRFIIGADSISPDSSGFTTGNAALTTGAPTAGRLPSNPAGSYSGTTYPTNPGWLTGLSTVGQHAALTPTKTPGDGSGGPTLIAPPALALRWLVRYR